MKKFTKEELYKMDAVDIYKMVLKGDVIKRFPNGFWHKSEAKQNATKCIHYLIEDILKYNEEDIKKKLTANLFHKNKLTGMLLICFNHSPYEAINAAYPNKFKEWQFNQTPNKYWHNKENGIRATKWLIEEKLKLNDEQLKEQLSQNLFIDNDLAGMLNECFNCSPYEAINSVYPNKFKEWELKFVPRKYWNDKENGIKATKWLVEQKLKLSDDELRKKLSFKLFTDNNLSGMLMNCFNNSPYEAINSVYPNKFKEWEFKCVPRRYWNNKSNGIRSTQWLIEEKLKLNDEQLKEQLSQNLFRDNGLSGMLQHCFNNSPYEAINNAYPNKFKQSDFKNYKYYKMILQK